MGFLSFKYESASAMLDFLADDMAMLTSVQSTMRRLGDGNGLMKAICAYADVNCMAVLVYVGTHDVEDAIGEPMDDNQLIKWYEKFGFKLQYTQPQMHPQMIRYSATEKVRPIAKDKGDDVR